MVSKCSIQLSIQYRTNLMLKYLVLIFFLCLSLPMLLRKFNLIPYSL